jgi:hypothetical protein
MGPAIACHCRECRKQSGHHFASAPVPKNAVTLTRDAGLAWYKASPEASRGFCSMCGSTLFWQYDDSEQTYILLGAIDGPTGLHLTSHVWVSEKGDYYDIADGVKQFEKG